MELRGEGKQCPQKLPRRSKNELPAEEMTHAKAQGQKGVVFSRK